MSWNNHLKPDATTSQDLSLDALSYTTAYGRKKRIESVTIHASVNITEAVTITLDSVNGANYDTILATENLEGQKDFVWRPVGGWLLQAGDEIKIQCTNANSTGTVYATVKASELL